MKALLSLAAFVVALLATSAGALVPEQNWIIGRWDCFIGGTPGGNRVRWPMTWTYQGVSCWPTCVYARPKGWLRGDQIRYVSGDATRFMFIRTHDGFGMPMRKTSELTMFGSAPIGENLGIAMECRRAVNVRDAAKGPRVVK
jgi:hypothetical protein